MDHMIYVANTRQLYLIYSSQRNTIDIIDTILTATDYIKK